MEFLGSLLEAIPQWIPQREPQDDQQQQQQRHQQRQERGEPTTTTTTTREHDYEDNDPSAGGMSEFFDAPLDLLASLANPERLARYYSNLHDHTGAFRGSFTTTPNSDNHDVRHPRSSPPCSRRALQQLPHVKIAPSDLVYDNNRCCSICLEEHHVNDVVVRLPCAHLFHPNCIIPWLQQQSCWCPVCHYELPTDDPQYEQLRLERMKVRKPQFHAHELSQLSIQQLSQLGPKPHGCYDTSDWITALIERGDILVLPSPPPMVLSYNILQEMTIKELQHTMQEAGVFYDPKHVIEKDDLMTIFVQSGRLHIVDVPTVQDNDDPPECRQEDDDEGESEEAEQQSADVLQDVEEGDDATSPTSEDWIYCLDGDVDEIDNNISGDSTPEDAAASRPTIQLIKMTRRGKPVLIETVDDSLLDTDHCDDDVDEIDIRDFVIDDTMIGDDHGQWYHGENPEDDSASIGSDTGQDDNGETKKRKRPSTANSTSLSTRNELEEASGVDHQTTVSIFTYLEQRFQMWSLVQLRKLASELNIDVSRCLERHDLIEPIVAIIVVGGCRCGASSTFRCTCHPIDLWGKCELQAISTAFNNLGTSSSLLMDDVQDEILKEQNVAYLCGILLLRGQSITHLRTTARKWRVDVSDCLEKKELLLRLVQHYVRYRYST